MKYIDNRINANIVKLEDANTTYASENVEGVLEEIDSKIKIIEANGYDDTQIKQHINNIKTEIGTKELTTIDQTVKGAVNEIDSKIKKIDNEFINLNEFERLETETGDSERLQRAFDFATENNIRTINFSGTLNLKTPVTIKNAICLKGENPLNSKILYNTTIGGYAIEIIENETVQNCIIFSNITFDCESQTAGRSALGLRHNNTKIIIENCNFYNCKNGIEMTGHSYGNTIRNCNFSRIQNNGILSSGNAEQFTIDKCWFDYGDNGNSCAVNVTNATSGQILNSVIQNYTTGIKAIGCKPLHMESLHFEDCINESVLITPNGKGYFSEGNSLKNVYIRSGKRGVTINTNPTTFNGRVVKGVMFENITITSVTEGGIVCDNAENLISSSVVNCGFHNDFSTDLDFIKGFTPTFKVDYGVQTSRGIMSLDGRLEANQMNIKGLPAYKFANLGGILGLTYNDSARFCVGSGGNSIYGNGTKGAQINYSSTSDSKPGFTFNGYNSTGYSIGENGQSLIMVINGVKCLELLSNGTLRLKEGTTITYDL